MAGKARRSGKVGRAIRCCPPRPLAAPPRRARWAVAIAAAMGAGSAQAENVIAPDGRTDTRVDVDGRTTDITTNTVRGRNGFNSFHHFKVAPEHTVNLRLPSGTRSLINLVHDSRAVIDGTLNGVLDGRIGGHVVFADPHGVVVGASGVVNVGSLLLTTPTQAFMDEVIGPDGRIGDAAVQRLLDGDAPDSGEGVIRIDGEVNATGAIAIEGTGVAVSGSLRSASPEARKALFEAAVNTEGLEEGFEIVADGGVIAIRGAGDVTVDGTLDVAGIEDTDGGSVSVRAARDVRLESGARIDASGGTGTADGGTVDVWADRSAHAGTGARVDAAAGDSGDGGFIEISAADTVTVNGLRVRAAGSGGGAAGTFLVDPDHIVFSADGSSCGDAGTCDQEPSFYSDGANAEFVADESITLLSGSVINTRQVAGGADADDAGVASIGDSGDVTLTAPRIEVRDGAAVFAFATDGFSGGDITHMLISGRTMSPSDWQCAAMRFPIS